MAVGDGSWHKPRQRCHLWPRCAPMGKDVEQNQQTPSSSNDDEVCFDSDDRPELLGSRSATPVRATTGDGQPQESDPPSAPGAAVLSLYRAEAENKSLREEVARLVREADAHRRDRADRLDKALAAQRELSLRNEAGPTFEEAWAKKKAEGYRYGPDALERVRFGWEMRASYEADGTRTTVDAPAREIVVEIVEWLNGLEHVLNETVRRATEVGLPESVVRRGIYSGIADDIKRKWG